jgi:hypothetical protein
MKHPIMTLVLLTIVLSIGVVPAATAARRSAQNYDQRSAPRQSGGSWQCYPYCEGGTYEGRPVREWLKPDRW